MIEKVSLFRNSRDFFHFLILAFTLFTLSISYEFYNYKELTKFDSQLVDAVVLKQYTKTKVTKKGKIKNYQVLKLKSDKGFTFYSTASKKLRDLKYKKVQLEAWAGDISFYEYMHGFYCFSKIVTIYPDTTLKTKLNNFINSQHQDTDISLIYQALFSAKQLPLTIQQQFSTLGISHLIAISGFHLGVLSTLLFFLFKYPYKLLQNQFFPYRSYKRDSFTLISLLLLLYLIFLDTPPSLLRAFVMLLIGFILYDRGMKVLSMQTLLLTAILILALFPRLFFSIGFYLSLSGVFYIFLFLHYFHQMHKVWQFILLPFWVYILMLPFSLYIFGNFSALHPISILLTTLFTLFYPLTMFLHLIGYGGVFDAFLHYLLALDIHTVTVELNLYYLLSIIALSLLSLYKKWFLYPLLLLASAIFIYSLSLL